MLSYGMICCPIFVVQRHCHHVKTLILFPLNSLGTFSATTEGYPFISTLRTNKRSRREGAAQTSKTKRVTRYLNAWRRLAFEIYAVTSKSTKNRIPNHARNEYNVCRLILEAYMAGEKILTLRLDGSLRGKLDKLATATRRSRSFLAAEAIREYVALNSWQIEEIHKGLIEADRGEFASENDVKKLAKKWSRRAH